MKNAGVLLVAVGTFSSCFTLRPLEDRRTEELTGYRTMNSTACFLLQADCIEAAIKAAERECQAEGKLYQYGSHSYTQYGSAKYRCESPVSVPLPSPVPKQKVDPNGIGACSAKEVAEMQEAKMSASAMDRACSP